MLYYIIFLFTMRHPPKVSRDMVKDQETLDQWIQARKIKSKRRVVRWHQFFLYRSKRSLYETFENYSYYWRWKKVVSPRLNKHHGKPYVVCNKMFIKIKDWVREAVGWWFYIPDMLIQFSEFIIHMFSHLNCVPLTEEKRMKLFQLLKQLQSIDVQRSMEMKSRKVLRHRWSKKIRKDGTYHTHEGQLGEVITLHYPDEFFEYSDEKIQKKTHGLNETYGQYRPT